MRAFSRGQQKEVLAGVVPQGSPVSKDYERCFGLQNGDQAGVNASITILEGDDGCDVADAMVLAEFPLAGLPAGPVDDRVTVVFHVDADGLVRVEATDTSSGKSISQTVDPKSN